MTNTQRLIVMIATVVNCVTIVMNIVLFVRGVVFDKRCKDVYDRISKREEDMLASIRSLRR